MSSTSNQRFKSFSFTSSDRDAAIAKVRDLIVTYPLRAVGVTTVVAIVLTALITNGIAHSGLIPQALLAQYTYTTDPGAPTCPTGDTLYRAVAGQKAQQLAYDAPATNTARVTTKANFNAQGVAQSLRVSVSPRSGNGKIFIDGIYTAQPVSTSAWGTPTQYRAGRWIVPSGVSTAEMKGGIFGRQDMVTVCVTPNGPR